MFFCASLVTMFLLSRSKAASAPASNGNKRQFSKEELNKATGNLQTALNKIANQHVLKYANAIRANAKAQASAVRANAVAAEAPTPTNLKNAVNAVARNAAALANFNARITAANNRTALTKIEVNIQNYASKHNIPYNRNNVKKRLNAVNTKRNNLLLLQPHPLKN